MKKIPNLITWIFFYIFIFFFLLHNSYSYLDPDLGNHLQTAKEIIKSGELPNTVIHDYTIYGKAWVAHEWLSEITIYAIYNNLGYLALNIFFVLIIITILILLNVFIHKNYLKNKNEFVFILLLQLLGVIAIAPHCGIRLQEITLLFLTLELVIIYYFNKKKNYKLLFVLLPFFYLWSNLHPGFLLGLAVLGFFVVIKTLELILYKKYKLSFIDFNILKIKNIVIFIMFSLASFILTLLTPYGLKLYAFLTDCANTYYLKHISEWLPQYYFPFNYWQIFYLAIIVTFTEITIINAIRTKKSYMDIWQIGLVIVFACLAIKSKRHFPLLFVASFPFLFYALKSFMSLPKNFLVKNDLIKKIFYFYLTITLLLLSFLYLIKTNYTKDPFVSFLNNYPLRAIKYLKDNPQYNDLNILNPYDWGSYITWVYPERKLFIDGRFSQFKYNNHTLLEEYHEFFDKDKIAEKIKQHNIQLILLKNKEEKYRISWLDKFFGIDENKINNQKNYLKIYLNNSSEWQIIYQDEISAIYKK